MGKGWTDEQKIAFQKKLSTMPKRHPFEQAELCELYCYDDMPTYVTRPAYDAFTWPVYDSGSKSFLYRHHDMEAETVDDVAVDLIDLLSDATNTDFTDWLCVMFKVPSEDVGACMMELKKLYEWEDYSIAE